MGQKLRIKSFMRLRNIPGARDIIAENDFVIHNPEQCKGRWNTEIFKNNNPIRIEIGMGKGRFITQLAIQNPDINYIGIEKYSSVLLRGIQKMESMENPPDNLVFLRFDADYITDIFAEDEIDRIYLNFSDPWPKDRHAKRRLPSKEFIAKYKKIMPKDHTIEFKTDNPDLFDFALEEAPLAGAQIIAKTFDLHNDCAMNDGNIMTEYEERFSKDGNKIRKCIIKI